jgi:PAS domain S-box-containing protein
MDDGARAFRELVEISQGLICRHALDGTLLYTNPASARQLGFEREELIGRNVREGLAPGVAHLFDAYLERIRRNGTDHGLLRLRDRAGAERVWFYRNQLVEETGRPPYVIGHAVDVTERVESERRLRESEERARAVVEALEEGILFLARDGRIDGTNRSAERLLGRPAAELVGRTPFAGDWDAVRDDESPLPDREHPAMVTLLTGQPCTRVVMGVLRPDRTRVWIEMNSQPVMETGRDRARGVVVSFTEVTERRERERRREEDLREALSHLRILRGLLPICAGCKKIRDETAGWQPLEEYVREHSEAEFTHGLCPDCERRLLASEPRHRTR